MITELVLFDLPKGITREEAMAKYRQSIPTWSGNEDLLHKAYFFDEEKSQGGGVYLWKSAEAARRWHGEEFLAETERASDVAFGLFHKSQSAQYGAAAGSFVAGELERPRRSIVEPLQDGSLARGYGGEEFSTNQVPDLRVMEKHL